MKIKEEKKNDIQCSNAKGNEETKKENKEDTEQNKKQKKTTTNKHTKKTHPIKEMNEIIKIIQKENEKRKAVIRTQRWRLRTKLEKDNTDKQPTVPKESSYNSRSRYDW